MSQNLKKMLFWGHIGNVHHPMEEQHHLSPVRSHWHAKAFSEAGYDVTMAVFRKSGAEELSPTLRRVHIFNLKPDDYDVMFLNFRLAANQLYNYSHGLEQRHKRIFEAREPHFKALLDHPNKVIQLDAPRTLVTDKNRERETELVQSLKGIGVSTELGVKNWNRNWGKVDNAEAFLCNAATISWRPEKGADPMPDNGRKRVLYLGRLNDASSIPSMQKLEELAKRLPHVDFITVSCKVKNPTTGKIIAPMLTDPDDVTEKKVEEARALFKAPNIIYMPGPRYHDTFQYMYHADVGIGFAVRSGQDVGSCKVYEYLGTGLPVVLEAATPEAFLLDEVECGLKSKTHDFDDMASKIEATLAQSYNRDHIMSHVLDNHVYERRIPQYEEYFNDA